MAAMKRFDSSIIGVDEGEIALFSDYESGGAMWTEKGSRAVKADVTFSEPFLAPPSVRVGLTLWDFARETNTRAELHAENVTETGFTVVFRTWNDTRIARARVGWQAIGPLRSDDEWVLI